MGKKDKVNMTTIPIGENKTLFVCLDNNRKYSNALGFFVKNEGSFTERIALEDVEEHIDETTPVVAFMFKNKKSITDLIKFLRFYLDNIYKKPYLKNDEVDE